MMEFKSVYIVNGFLLVLPILVWNLLFGRYLPGIFQSDHFDSVPVWIILGEQTSRILFFILAYLMPLALKLKGAKIGLSIYLFGLAAYFSCWLALTLAPNSHWSTSLLGFIAPAWTPAIWMIGICLLGRHFSFGIRYRWWIPVIIIASFLFFHVLHAVLAYKLVA